MTEGETNANEPVLAAEDIAKSFGRVQVLRGVNLTIHKGDRYVLFGSNGAGKTTLVKILSTLMSPDKGKISLFGKEEEQSGREVKARIGFMSHEPYLYAELTAWENLEFYASLYNVPDKEKIIKDLLKEVGLYHRAHDQVAPFSRGMKQRLGLARAVLHDPDLIFLDEPYAGLDLKAQKILNNLIIQQNRRGKTFFFITHDVSRGFEIAKRSGVLSGGRIVYEQDGGSKEDFSRRFEEIIGGEKG